MEVLVPTPLRGTACHEVGDSLLMMLDTSIREAVVGMLRTREQEIDILRQEVVELRGELSAVKEDRDNQNGRVGNTMASWLSESTATNRVLIEKSEQLERQIVNMNTNRKSYEKEMKHLENDIVHLRSENQQLLSSIENYVTQNAPSDVTLLVAAYKSQLEASMSKIQNLRQHVTSLNHECKSLDSENITLSNLICKSRDISGIPLPSLADIPPASPPERHWVFGSTMRISFRLLSMLFSSLMIIVTSVVVVAILVNSSNNTIQSTKQAGSSGVNVCLDGGTKSVSDLTSKLLSRIVKQVAIQLLSVVEAPHRHARDMKSVLESYDVDEIGDPTTLRHVIKRNLLGKLKASVSVGVSVIALQMEGTTPKAYATGHDPQPAGDGRWGGITVVMAEGTNQSLYCAETFDRNGHHYGRPTDIGFGSVIDSKGTVDTSSPCRDIQNGKLTTGLCVFPETYIFNFGIKQVYARSFVQEKNVVHISPAVPTVNHITIFSYLELSNVNMKNIFNKQGILVVGTRLEQIVSVFSSINASIPDNAVLYGVEQNPWTGEIATMIGTNVGPVVNKSENPAIPSVAADIKNYEHPIIREHYLQVIKTEGNYTSLSQSQSLQVLAVSNDNGTVSYYAKIEKIDFHELTWYVSLVVPRESVMGEIDETVASVKAQFAKSNVEVDSDKERDFAVALGAVCGVVLASVAVAVVATSKIVEPLLTLENEMNAVADMKLEAVDETSSISRLKEIGQMQTSFKKMVYNLLEYRNYMPQSVLCETSDDEMTQMNSGVCSNSERTSAVDDTSTALSGSLGMSRSAVSPSGYTKSDQPYTYSSALKQNSDLKKKNVTFVAFNVVGFHDAVRTMHSGDCQVYHAEIIQQLTLAVSSFKGMAETFSGDRLLASYNALRQVSTHRNSACSAVCYFTASLKKSVITQSTNITAAIACGEARVGNMGCQGMKKYALLSETLSWCYGLERFSRHKMGRGCVLDESVQHEAELTYECCIVGGVTFPKLHAHRTFIIYKLGHAKTAKDEEWMYQMEDARENSIYAAWNTTLKSAFKQDWAKARVNLAAIPPAQLEGDLSDMVNIREWIRTETVAATGLTYH